MKSTKALPHVWLFLLHRMLLDGDTVLAQQSSQIESGVTLMACPAEQQWSYSLSTDDYPWETSWELVKIVANGNRHYVASGPAAGAKYARRKNYTDVVCLDYGEYQLTLRDSMGDGFCCDNGQGHWIMTLGDQVVGQVEAGQFRTTQLDFQVGDLSTTATTAAGVTTTSTDAATTTQLATTTVASLTTTDPTISLTSSPPTSAPTATAAPTTDPWLTFNPRHSKFCGPKVVGGFAVAVSQCGPKTMCGLTTQSNQYGSHGNDCPKGLMCYSDIVCQNGPNAKNAAATNGRAVDGEFPVDGRTIGAVKTNEVVLKQDMETNRWFPEENIDSLNDETENASRTNRLCVVLYCALLCGFGIVNQWFT